MSYTLWVPDHNAAAGYVHTRSKVHLSHSDLRSLGVHVPGKGGQCSEIETGHEMYSGTKVTV